MNEPRIATLPPKKFIGQRVRMSLTNNKTAMLFQGFMPRRREIVNTVSNDIFCVQVYDSGFNIHDFGPETEHTKWAAVEVTHFDDVPPAMEILTLPGGLYAVFLHQGAANDFEKTFHFIYADWLPRSGYVLDAREHFEILGEKYKNNQPDSEEEVWVPVRLKAV